MKMVPIAALQGVDIDALVKPGFNLLIHRRTDGGWSISYAHG